MRMGRLCAEAPLDRQFLGTRFRVSEENVLSGAYAFMSLQHCRKLSTIRRQIRPDPSGIQDRSGQHQHC